LLHGCGLGDGDGVGAVTPVPGLVAGMPALGIQGFVTVVVVLPGVPALVLPGGVVEPAGFVIDPGCVPNALVPDEAPGVVQGPETVLVVGLEEMLPVPGLGLACGETPPGLEPGEAIPGVVFWLGVVVVLWLGVVVVDCDGVVVVLCDGVVP